MKTFLTLSLVALATLFIGCAHHEHGWHDKGDHKEYRIGDKGHSDDTDMSITVKAPKDE